MHSFGTSSGDTDINLFSGEIRWTGRNLHRPECVLATASGDVFAADWQGGVTHIRSDGRQLTYLAQPIDGMRLQPNGIALLRDGSFLIAHLGPDQGGVFRLERDGTTLPFVLSVDGKDLPPSNFVVEDASGRVWVTVSTRRSPRALGYRADVDDGFIVVVDDRGARIVADGLGYANECLLDADGEYLYVNETFARRLSRFAVRTDGSLGAKEVVVHFGAGTFPDGLAQDVEGDLWITSIVSNRLIRVSRDGRQTIYLEDCARNHLSVVEDAYERAQMGREHLDAVHSKTLKNISSLAFGGADLRTGYLGCLLGDSLATVRMPVAGRAPTHWNYT